MRFDFNLKTIASDFLVNGERGTIWIKMKNESNMDDMSKILGYIYTIVF